MLHQLRELVRSSAIHRTSECECEIELVRSSAIHRTSGCEYQAIMHVAFGRVRRRIALLQTEFTHSYEQDKVVLT